MNNVAYVGSDDGKLYAININNGTLKWNYDMGKPVYSSPTIDTNDNSLFVGADNGKMVCLDTRNGVEKWSYNATGAVKTSAAIVKNKIVFGSDGGTVYIVNKYNGNLEWNYNPGYGIINQAIQSSPAVYGNMIYIGADDGSLYALNNDKMNGPTSVYAYYIGGTLVILAIFLVAVKIIRKRSKKAE